MIATISNLIYGIAGGVALGRKMYAVSVMLVVLAVCSGAYHYTVWMGNPSAFWQDADVSAIYLVLGLLPYTFTGNKESLIYLVPAAILILLKFNVIDINLDSYIVVPLMAVPALISGYFCVKPAYYRSAIIFMVFAAIFTFIGNQFGMNQLGYDVSHGAYWHTTTGIAFGLLISGIPKTNCNSIEN